MYDIKTTTSSVIPTIMSALSAFGCFFVLSGAGRPSSSSRTVVSTLSLSKHKTNKAQTTARRQRLSDTLSRGLTLLVHVYCKVTEQTVLEKLMTDDDDSGWALLQNSYPNLACTP